MYRTSTHSQTKGGSVDQSEAHVQIPESDREKAGDAGVQHSRSSFTSSYCPDDVHETTENGSHVSQSTIGSEQPAFPHWKKACRPIPRLDYRKDSVEIHRKLAASEPVVIRHFDPVLKAVGHWDFWQLYELLGSKPEFNNTFTVHTSRTGKFMYSDEGQNTAGFEFDPGKETHHIKFGEFASEFQKRCESRARHAFHDERSKQVKQWDQLIVSDSPELDLAVQSNETEPANSVASSDAASDGSLEDRKNELCGVDAAGIEACAPNNPIHRKDTFSHMTVVDKCKELMYLQQKLYASLPDGFSSEFSRIDWDALYQFVGCHGWQSLTSNVLLIGHEGCVTTIHFDEQENLFFHIKGRKLCVLAPPAHYLNLYPYPCNHPGDRQSQTDVRDMDLNKFPDVNSVDFLSAELEPGDMLYIPLYWWHYIESCTDSISLNFWFHGKPRQTDFNNLLPDDNALVTFYRNIEKIASDFAGPRKAADAFRLLDNLTGVNDLDNIDWEEDGEGSDTTDNGDIIFAGGASATVTKRQLIQNLIESASHLVDQSRAFQLLKELAHRRFRYLSFRPTLPNGK